MGLCARSRKRALERARLRVRACAQLGLGHDRNVFAPERVPVPGGGQVSDPLTATELSTPGGKFWAIESMVWGGWCV